MANTIIEILIALTVILSIVGFLAGIVLLVVAISEKDPKKKKNLIIWTVSVFFGGPVLLFVILSIWGLVSILTHTATGV